jgi:hypothetical protein
LLQLDLEAELLEMVVVLLALVAAPLVLAEAQLV